MDQCSEVDTPITKNGQDSLNNGEELHEEEARRARRAIARVNYMAQDRPISLLPLVFCPNAWRVLVKVCSRQSNG